MNTKTKIQPAERVSYPYRSHTLQIDKSGRVITDMSSEGSSYFNRGANRIEYALGPRTMLISNRKVPNWKWCSADGNGYWLHSPCNYTLHQRQKGSINTIDTYVDGQRTLLPVDIGIPTWSGWPAHPTQPDYDEVCSAVWDEISLRTNDSLLALEDVAGFVSGNSLWGAIRGVAYNVNHFAKTVRDLRRVRKVLGGKLTLYQLWQSSKDVLCSVLGLRLGYRFSFKTTLHDIFQACEWADQFNRYVQTVDRRNGGEYLRYTKSAVNTNTNDSEINSWTVKNYCYHLNDSYSSWVSTPPASIQFAETERLTIVAYAKVRYMTDRATLRRYIERQLGLDRPLSTLWAIVPLSFLIDYLIPVQDMASYFDNWLNDYDVATSFSSAWALRKGYGTAKVTFPGFSYSAPSGSYPIRLFTSGGSTCTYVRAKHFERFPIRTSDIRDHFPGLIKSQDDKWYRNVGTGLEILSQLHR